MQDVFITGRGLISPAGFHFNEIWKNLVEGRTALAHHNGWAQGRIAPPGETRVRELAEEKVFRAYDRGALLAVLAAREAVYEAGVTPDRHWMAMVGSSRGATQSLEDSVLRHAQNERLRPSTSPGTTLGSFSAAVARATGCAGLSLSVSAACATSLHAIGMSFLALRSGFAKGAVAGGAESSLTPYTFEMLHAAQVLSRSQTPYPCRPFHPERDGMTLGEGGAVVILETAPGNLPLARIRGYGAATESATLTGISATGKVLHDAVADALAMAALNPEDIDLIVGHGSGTTKGDAAESQAYRTLFGPRHPPLALHKWMTGHLLGAAGAFSVGMAIEHLVQARVPRHPYFDDDASTFSRDNKLDRARHALVTSLGFGGNAGALVIELM